MNIVDLPREIRRDNLVYIENKNPEIRHLETLGGNEMGNTVGGSGYDVCIAFGLLSTTSADHRLQVHWLAQRLESGVDAHCNFASN